MFLDYVVRIKFQQMSCASYTSLVSLLLPYSSTLEMEAICSSEQSVNVYRTTRGHIPEDSVITEFTKIENFYIGTFRINTSAVLVHK
jgi:hypothetical protein